MSESLDAFREARFRAMGTDVLVVAAGGPTDLDVWAASRVEALEARWSRFRPESELSRLNAAGGAPVVLSSETLALVSLAVESWRLTGGRFDPTVLPALRAAGYDRDFAAVPRDTADPVPDAVPAPGCAAVHMDPVVGSVQLDPGVALDLGGIGKGFAADLVATELLAAGAAGALVDLGGDLRAAGVPPEQGGWLVEVDHPLDGQGAGMLAVVDGAIATSTRVRRAWTRAGRVMHHLIDPRTGAPADHGLASVTVVAGETWRAEVLAKAALIAGPVEGARLVVDAGVTGLLVHDDGEVQDLPGLEAFRVSSS